ncbi:MAG: hypothetical protein GY851_34935 [bacterium]|nr:hypothetical protein [bacterium]
MLFRRQTVVLAVLLAVAASAHGAPRTLTPQELGNLEANCARYPEAAALRERLVAAPDKRLLEATDEWLIDFLPEPHGKRTLFVLDNDITYGCPIHGGGRYVFKGSADPFRPYQLKCSIGRETYPNADFPESGTLESSWDEQGWLDTRETVDGIPNPTFGMRYYWNAHYAYWGRWMRLAPFMQDLAIAHFLVEDGDPVREKAGHAAAVLLLRLTAVFPEMRREDFDSTEWVQGFPYVVRIMDYVWEPGHTDRYARSYDLVREHILSDESLLRLDYARTGTAWGDDPGNDLDGDGSVTTADLCLWVENDLLREYGRLYAAIPPSFGNATMVHQRTMCQLAIILDDASLYEQARATLVDHIATNWFTNDGAYYEGSPPGYGLMGIRALRDSVTLLRRFDPDLTVPRVVTGYHHTPSITCLDAVVPNPDDAMGVTLGKYTGRPRFRTGDYVRAFFEYGDPRLLRPVVLAGAADGTVAFDAYTDLFTGLGEENQKTLDAALDAFRLERLPTAVTRSGYATLRGGADTDPFDLFVTFDGYGGSHSHYDALSALIYGYGYALVPDIGYPDDLLAPARKDWVSHTLAHWSVTIDRTAIDTDFERSHLRLLADLPGFKAIGLEAPSAYKERASLYRRVLLFIDRPGSEPPVAVDLFDVDGGHEHLYSFHGAAREGVANASVLGATMSSASEHETLQGMWHGASVPYGDPLEDSDDRCLAYLERPRPLALDGDAPALRVRFPRDDDDGTAVDLWVPVSCADDFVMAEGRSCPIAHQRNVRLPCLIARHGSVGEGGPLQSRFRAVVEAHQGNPGIESVSRADGDGIDVKFRSGDTWHIVAEGYTVSFVARGADGQRTRAVKLSPSPPATIGAVDYEARSVSFAEGDGPAVGTTAFITNELGRNTYYTVQERRPDGAVVLGDQWTDLRVARGFLTGERDGGRLLYEAEYEIKEPVRAQCHGARIRNAAGQSLCVRSVDAEAVTVEGTDADIQEFVKSTVDTCEGQFSIFDFGPGDSVGWTLMEDAV